MNKYKLAIKKLVNKLGIEIYRIPPLGTSGYEQILPVATYAPWSSDHEFMETFNLIKDNTLVDKYRCYELWNLVSQCSKLNGALIEIGVWRGGTGGLICKKANLMGLNKSLYLADTFHGVVKTGSKDTYYKGGEHDNTSVGIVDDLLQKKLKVNNYEILEGVFPDETSHLIHDNIFSFCHIDVDAYDSAKDIVSWIWPKLEIGGMIIFDDYGFDCCEGVTNFVNEQIPKPDRLIIHNLNGHAIIIRIK